jgi:hypothetical protein
VFRFFDGNLQTDPNFWTDSNRYPLVNIQKTIEHGPVEIVDLPINSMVIFHGYVSLPEGKF